MAHPNQYTPKVGDVVSINRRCSTCGRKMVAHYMGEDAWCPYCKATKQQDVKAADQIAKAWGR